MKVLNTHPMAKTFAKTFGAIALLAAACGASAGPLDSAASFQVTSFSYVASGGTLSWNPTSGYQTLYSESGEAGGLVSNDIAQSTDYELTNSTLSSSRPHATSTLTSSAIGTVSGSSVAVPFVISDVSQPHFGNTMAQQSREFSLSAPGSVTFTIEYSLVANSVSANANENFSVASLDFSFGNYANASGGAQNLTILSSDAANGHNANSGSLVFTVDFGAADEIGSYNLRGNAYASASAAVTAVPEPQTYALMLAGLAAIGAIARRKSAAKQ